MNGEYQESPGRGEVYQGPPGAIRVGEGVEVSVEFIDTSGISMTTLVGAGVVKDTGCRNVARFVADFGRRQLKPA